MPTAISTRRPLCIHALSAWRSAALISLALFSACDRREPTAQAPVTVESPAPVQPAKPVDVLVFPSALRVSDEAVNAFVERAMAACSTGNYDEFRRLWSAQRDPLPRGEFEQGWQAVKTIRVRALQKIILGQAADSETESAPEAGSDQEGYVLLADLSLDPKHPAGQDQPKREAALLIVRERDEWCLTKAPKQVRDWVKAHFVSESAASPDAVTPSDPSAAP